MDLKNGFTRLGLLSLVSCLSFSALGQATDAKEYFKDWVKFRDVNGLELDFINKDKKAKANFAFARGLDVYTIGFERAIDAKDVEFLNLDGITPETKINIGWLGISSNSPAPPPRTITADSQEYKTMQAFQVQLFQCQASEQAGTLPAGEDCKDEKEAYQLALNAVSEKLDGKFSLLADFTYYIAKAAYLDSNLDYYSLDEQKNIDDNREGFEFTIGYGRSISKSRSRWELGTTYQQGYERGSDNKQRNICTELPQNNSFTECFDAFLLSPVEIESYIPYYKYTKLFPEDSLFESIQFHLKYVIKDDKNRDGSRKESENAFIMEVPLHLFTLWEDKLSTGVKFTYNTKPTGDNDKFNMGLFLSAPLTLTTF